MKHLILILLIITALVTGIFLPYVHSEYDDFATGFSYIFQFALFASLLLVPTGLVWCAMDLRNRKNKEPVRYPRYFRKFALGITVIIILLSALSAFASHNRFSAIIILGAGFYFVWKSWKKENALKPSTNGTLHAAPYYFIFIPLTVLFIRLNYLEKIKNASTDFVIQQSEQLIQDIEAYHKTYGHYPVSLQSTIEDYKPFVSGIARFQYERQGEAYNLYFEQFSDRIGTQEIVMYNKLDEHEMTVHNQDLLRVRSENIIRGYHEVVKLPQPHWKIFYFD